MLFLYYAWLWFKTDQLYSYPLWLFYWQDKSYTSIGLPKCTRSNPVEYEKIDHMNPLETRQHKAKKALLWRNNGCDAVSNHQPHDCLLICLFWRRSKKHQSSASLAFVRGIHRWPVHSRTKRASNAENVSIWWRHHELFKHFLGYIASGWQPESPSFHGAVMGVISCIYASHPTKKYNLQQRLVSDDL